MGLLLVEDLAGDLPAASVTCLLWEDADALTLAHDILDLTSPVLVVDCLDSSRCPGAHLVVEDASEHLRQAGRSASCHGFGLAEALALARALGFDQPLDVFGVQPACLDPATGLSHTLMAAMPSLREALRKEIHQRLSHRRLSPVTAESGGRSRP